LYDLLKPHASEVLVCDPRQNNLGKVGNKNDRNDARELAELLYRNKIKAVYHGEHGLRTLKELALSYLTITSDLTRVMARLKAIYRWGRGADIVLQSSGSASKANVRCDLEGWRRLCMANWHFLR